MAIPLLSALNPGGPFPVDVRLMLSKAQMLNINDNLMPDTYFAVCTTDNKFYIYDKYAESDPETGKFHAVSDEELKKDIERIDESISDIQEDIAELENKVEDITTMTSQDIDNIINS